MGELLSLFREAPRSAEFVNDPSLDEIDSATGLTFRQKKVIAETWKVAEDYLHKNKADFFLAIFKAHPSYQKEFKSLATVPFEELRENKKMQAHSFNVTFALSALVNSLDDVECLKEQLIGVGERHGKRKLNYSHFESVPPLFVDFMAEKLGSGFTPFARTAWLQAFDVMNSFIKQGLDSVK